MSKFGVVVDAGRRGGRIEEAQDGYRGRREAAAKSAVANIMIENDLLHAAAARMEMDALWHF